MSSTTGKIFKEIQQIRLQTIPSYLQFNPRITRGYRVGYNFRSLLKSLFQWHNQTINTWTHLIGAVLIFSVIFSSNLFTQHYHSKHQILNFRDSLQDHQLNLTQGQFGLKIHEYENYSNTINQGFLTLFLRILEVIQKQVGIIIKLTEEDSLIYRKEIINRFGQFILLKEHIQNLVILSINQNTNISGLSIKQLCLRFEEFHIEIHKIVADIISLIEKLADNVNPIPKWPLLVFFFTASICLTFSFTFHLFHPHSESLYKILRKLDFSGVILLIVGSSFPFLVYGTTCVSNFASTYLFIMSLLGLLAFSLLVSGYFDPRSRQKKKSLLFGLLGVSFIVPISHILILEYMEITQDSLPVSHFIIRVFLLGGIYLFGLFIYTVQCPQRYIEGKFDYCGASHQLWHLSVLVALYITYEVNWDLYYQRRINPCLC